ncbi:MAG: SAM-dependent methyltransferase [Rickettsiaceae bacterium H1]|nr:SAM-dependent methyltransferase [Rickettsiaceae bacterium H1]
MLSSLNNLIEKSDGSISIAEFMNFALYDKQYGYYMKKNPIGLTGDFITAPEISQLFAETIAIWVILEWEKLGRPKSFGIAELGPGKGTMMFDIIGATKKYFFDYINIYLLEISPFLQKIQKKTLSGYKHKITWIDNLEKLPNQPTIFIVNEFFDALPIRQFIYKQKWYEQVVTLVGDKLNFALKTTDRVFGTVNENSVIELNESLSVIYNKIKNHIKCNGGTALIIDYGYTDKTYISTLQAVKAHRYHNVLNNIGEIDITAHVDFSLFTDCKLSTQRDFLHFYGIKERAAVLLKDANVIQAKEIMVALHRLTHPELMGEIFKCAVL